MTDEKMREEFEAWASSVLLQEKVTQDFIKGMREGDTYSLTGFSADHARKYLTGIVSAGWMSWQESRAAIEVELSEPYAVIGDYAACGGGRSVLDVEYAEKITDQMCKKIPVYDRAQLEAAGLKVKP